MSQTGGRDGRDERCWRERPRNVGERRVHTHTHGDGHGHRVPGSKDSERISFSR